MNNSALNLVKKTLLMVYLLVLTTNKNIKTLLINYL